MLQCIAFRQDAENFAQSILFLKDNYGLDGIDLDVEDSAESAELQIAVIEALRDACGDDFHISYTFACLAEQFDPTLTVVQESHPILDTLNVMAYDAYWDG